MEELLKALTEAVRTGTAMAMPALVGYYIVYVITGPVTAITVAALIASTIRFGIRQYWTNLVGAEQAAAEKYRAIHAAHKAGYRPPYGD